VLFASFDDEPLAVASIAQVHAATTLDGVDVVVKVQVPGVEGKIAADVAALEVCARLLPELPGVDLPTVAAELHRCLCAELDYVREAAQLREFARQVPAHVIVPHVIDERSADRVLTMTRLRGAPLTAWLDAHDAADARGARDRLLGELVGEVAAQLLARGHLHGDLHAGNVMVTDAGQLALLDFGCTLRLSADERRGYARLLAALATGDAGAVPAALAELGFAADDPAALGEAVALLSDVARPGVVVDAVDWAALTARQLELVRNVVGLRLPPSFVLVGRVLAALGGLLATYRPAIDVHALLLPHVLAALAPAPARS
jgi:ubiquinone biosynthesis protein